MLNPTPLELLDRARNDLRIGLPIIIVNDNERWLIFSVETISLDRFSILDNTAEFSITEKRAKTLKAAAYHGNIGRYQLDKAKGLKWIRAIADPVSDLTHPMKGPFRPIRAGSAEAHNLGIILCKKARLLPAIIAQKTNLTDQNITTISSNSKDLIELDQEIIETRVGKEEMGAGLLPIRRENDGRQVIDHRMHGPIARVPSEDRKEIRKLRVLVGPHAFKVVEYGEAK